MLSGPTALIIPAHNEAERIGCVLESALASTELDNIIVVNDGSTDVTSRAALDYGVIVIEHAVNQGKGEAMQSGVRCARGLGATTLLFLDADLHGLLPSHIDSLITPVKNGEAIMSIGILERSLVQRSILRRWGALSGQRAMTLDFWDQLSAVERKGFRVEASLNASARHHQQHDRISRIELRHVTHTGKREKEPSLAKAISAYCKTYGAAAYAYVRAELTSH